MTTHKKPPSPYARGDGPRPTNERALIDEIKGLAEARRKDALTHPTSCTCDGCKIRRQQQHTTPRRHAA